MTYAYDIPCLQNLLFYALDRDDMSFERDDKMCTLVDNSSARGILLFVWYALIWKKNIVLNIVSNKNTDIQVFRFSHGLGLDMSCIFYALPWARGRKTLNELDESHSQPQTMGVPLYHISELCFTIIFAFQTLNRTTHSTLVENACTTPLHVVRNR